jgi:hypothetical protein
LHVARIAKQAEKPEALHDLPARASSAETTFFPWPSREQSGPGTCTVTKMFKRRKTHSGSKSSVEESFDEDDVELASLLPDDTMVLPLFVFRFILFFPG